MSVRSSPLYSVRHEGAIDQRMEVPPEHLLVRVYGYESEGRGDLARQSLGERCPAVGWVSEPSGRNTSES